MDLLTPQFFISILLGLVVFPVSKWALGLTIMTAVLAWDKPTFSYIITKCFFYGIYLVPPFIAFLLGFSLFHILVSLLSGILIPVIRKAKERFEEAYYES